ncbi:hypothetical protein [Moorena sp. SIO3H5]|nr:hypothetical protein [Moorena sp. SIO3H5]NEO68712.1 hypothetical protein [Moorena sp. SIO3H5]
MNYAAPPEDRAGLETPTRALHGLQGVINVDLESGYQGKGSSNYLALSG